MSSENKLAIPKWLKITIKVIEWALVLTLLVCMLTVVTQTFTGETPSLFGYTIYSVLTDSMSGTYEVGDVVICKRIKEPKETEFEVGDVIAFIAPENFDNDNLLTGHTITHRIVEGPYYDENKNSWFVITKGDNPVCVVDNVPIPLENIQGKIKGTNNVISKLMGFLRHWYGFVVLIVIPLLSILVWQLIVLAKESTKKNKEDINQKYEKQKQELKEQIEEEIKKKAIEEYIEQQNKE